jgi:hypothetical protein
MKILVEKPPNFERILAAFPHADGKVLFAYGDTIYNPKGIQIPHYLLAHEAVHGMRQLGQGGVDPWWDKYIDDAEFRYQEELASHRVEYAVLAQQVQDRNARAKLLMATAARLVAPLYSYKRSLLQAQKDLMA